MINGSYYQQFSVTSPYHDPRPTGPHSGVDLAMGVGTIVESMSDGAVIFAGDYGVFGWTIKVQSSEGFVILYAHLSHFGVSVGETVAVGSWLGLSGGEQGAEGAGNSTGPHLHITIHNASGATVDPMIYIEGTSEPEEALEGWQSLCISEANRQGCPTDIALATVEAETGGTNMIGDGGNALGYGQVWPKWHMDAFIEIGNQMGLNVPGNLAALSALVLSNDRYSMGVAVKVIKDTWDAAGGDWDLFTEYYVGPKIPSSDRERRRAIWKKYHGGYYDPSTGAKPNAGTGHSGSFLDGIFGDVGELAKLPQTEYEVIPGSRVLGDILYGRKWRIFVSDMNGEAALEVTNLHVTFKCVKLLWMAPQFSEIVIYNLSPEHENQIIKEGYRVVIDAGYEGGQFGTIYDGNVVQAIREKTDGHTYKLTLLAYDSDQFLVYGVSNFTMLRGQNSRTVIGQAARSSSVAIDIGSISDSLGLVTLARGKALFGKTSDYLRQIAKSENAYFYTENGRINMIKLTDLPENEAWELSPETGLIGVPTQNEYGANIQMLLNPRIRIKDLIHVDNSLIRSQEYTQPGQAIYMLDKDGLYRVIKITHIGDTRGPDWYTQVETVKQSGAGPEIMKTAEHTAQ